MKNKPYDKSNNTNSLGSDLTTAIQNFHYAGEMINKTDDEKNEKNIVREKSWAIGIYSIIYVVIKEFIKEWWQEVFFIMMKASLISKSTKTQNKDWKELSFRHLIKKFINKISFHLRY